MLIIAGVAAALMIPVTLLVRRPPGSAASPGPAQAGPAAPATAGEMTVAQALRSPQFLVLMATNFFCCATHSGPIIHTVSYAVTCGIPMVAAVSIYSLEGLSGLAGRLGFGVLGDRFGAKPVLVIGLLVQAFAALGYIAANGMLSGFYAAGALFGFVYAGVMPLYSVIARENFPMRMMGTIIGGISMGGSLGMATGPIAGGLIYDATGAYRWLYVGACVMGLGAFLIASTFKPFDKPPAQPVTPATALT